MRRHLTAVKRSASSRKVKRRRKFTRNGSEKAAEGQGKAVTWRRKINERLQKAVKGQGNAVCHTAQGRQRAVKQVAVKDRHHPFGGHDHPTRLGRVLAS